MSKFGRVRLVLALLSVAVITTIRILNWNTTPSTWYGYVASCDRRVHNFNLDTGELIWTSDEFEWMGQPMGLDIDRDRSILYIASGSYLPRQDYIPVVAVILNDTFDIVFSSTLYSNSTVFPSTNGIRLNSKLDSLYVSHLGSDALQTVLDSRTGEIIGVLDIPIFKHYEFSPEGNFLAEIFPSGSRMFGDELREWSGGVSTWDLRAGVKGELVELVDNQGLTPPWGSTDSLYVYARWMYDESKLLLEVYDRESGELLATHDFLDTFEFATGPRQMHVTHIPGRSDVAMSIGDSVVVFDPLTAEVKSRTIIPTNSCFSEVVVTDKPLIQSN